MLCLHDTPLLSQVRSWSGDWASGQSAIAQRLTLACAALVAWQNELLARQADLSARAEEETLRQSAAAESGLAERDLLAARVASLEHEIAELHVLAQLHDEQHRSELAAAAERCHRLEAERADDLALAQLQIEQDRASLDEFDQALAASLAEIEALKAESAEAIAARANYDEQEGRCQELETELETVRRRACELAETLEQYERQMEADRGQWANELRSLRALVEQPADEAAPAALNTRRLAVAAPVASAPATDAAGPDATVVSSIRAQFEKLRAARSTQRK